MITLQFIDEQSRSCPKLEGTGQDSCVLQPCTHYQGPVDLTASACFQEVTDLVRESALLLVPHLVLGS